MTQPKPSRSVAPIATMLLAIALGAIWLVPKGSVDENRALNDFSSPQLSSLASARFFRYTDAALVDHLGAKSAAVGFVGSLVSSMGLNPSTLVVRGPTGEPFYAGDFTTPCLNAVSAAQFDTAIENVKAHFEAKGIYFLYAIVPDKSAIERSAIGPFANPLMVCADASKQDFEHAADGGAVLTAWSEFESSEAAGHHLYIYNDSHWNYEGASLFSTLVLMKLAEDGQAPAGLLEQSKIVPGTPYEHLGDLSRFMGSGLVESLTPLSTEREGVTTVAQSQMLGNGTLTRSWQSSTTSSPLVSGRTLIIGDSEFDYNAEILAPYFEDLTFVHVHSLSDPGSIALVGGYDRVIVQQVQRTVPVFLDEILTAPWIDRKG